ncbi:MAG TPA: MarR family transcriptional regulator [Clostridiales bacterium]|nr:MarR family transcriptional regulator [Clostridiales bacterium]
MPEEIKQIARNLMEISKSFHLLSYHKSINKNLHPGQPKLLSLIKGHEGISQKELATMTCVKASTITGMLNTLEAKHFVYRLVDEADKRIMRVYLTPEGREVAIQSEQLMKNLYETLFKDFSTEELNVILSLSNKMIENLRKFES